MDRVKAAQLLARLIGEGAESAGEYISRAGMRLGRDRTTDEEIIRRLVRDAPALRDMAEEFGGFTADVSGPLSRGQMRTLPVEDPSFRGNMMATRPESAAARIPLSDVDDPQMLEEALRRIAREDRQFIPDLASGRYLGGWVKDGNLVVDTPRRFFSPRAANRAGIRSRQEAAFNLERGQVVPTMPDTMGAVRRRIGAGAAAGSGAALVREILGRDR